MPDSAWAEHAKTFNTHRGIGGLTTEIDALRAEVEDLTRLSQSYLTELSDERTRCARAEADRDALRAENSKLLVELTHRVGWEERCLRAETALRQILEDPDAKILDAHRDDGWEALHA